MHYTSRIRQIAMILTLLIPGGASMGVAQTTHLVAPAGAQFTCSGTRGQENCPWQSVDSALQSGTIRGGDTLVLKDGKHNRIDLENRSFTPSILIKSEAGRNAIVDTIFLRNASGVSFDSLTIQSSQTNPYPLFQSDSNTSNIELKNSHLQSFADVSNVVSWTASDWLKRRRHGVWISGVNTRVVNNTLDTVQSGVWSAGSGNLIFGNRIKNLSADGLRAGSDTIVAGNYVANFFRVDEDHIDGFQSIGSVAYPVKNLRLRRNTIIEWTHPGGHALQASTQGIGMFDGFYDDFSIRNNLIIVTAYHGIAVYGGRSGIISNNTVIHPSTTSFKYPWIGVFNHKNGTPSNNIIVANNLANLFDGASAANNIVFTDNQVVIRPVDVFVDPASFDYRPKLTSGFVDTANPAYAPKYDIDGVIRTQGAGPDKGAYEVISTGDSVARKSSTGEPLSTESLKSLSTEEDTIPTLKPPKKRAASEEPTDSISGQIILGNKKPIRLRKFWTDGATQVNR